MKPSTPWRCSYPSSRSCSCMVPRAIHRPLGWCPSLSAGPQRRTRPTTDVCWRPTSRRKVPSSSCLPTFATGERGSATPAPEHGHWPRHTGTGHTRRTRVLKALTVLAWHSSPGGTPQVSANTSRRRPTQSAAGTQSWCFWRPWTPPVQRTPSTSSGTSSPAPCRGSLPRELPACPTPAHAARRPLRTRHDAPPALGRGRLAMQCLVSPLFRGMHARTPRSWFAPARALARALPHTQIH
mmetsp:Transcript_103554/g.309365  ORF Transcript_103554/g.309365 Transcript_103554/m.309365 type:complete len:239 (-) Transcript_103554:212-928(-)